MRNGGSGKRKGAAGVADFPAIPLWTDAYLADTRHLTTEEHGAYLLLMMEAWRRPLCNLPDDDTLLARLVGVSSVRWAEIKPVVMAFWKRDGRSKTWSQKRLSRERDYVANRSESQRAKATKRWKNEKKNAAPALPNACQTDAPTPTPTPTPLEKEEPYGSSKKPRASRIKEDWVLPGEWGAWAEGQGLSAAAIVREADKFRDYWRGRAGNSATKLDWQATWRNWVRHALERQPQLARPPVQVGERRTLPDGQVQRFEAEVGWMTVG